MTKHTVRDPEVSVSEWQHTSLINRVSSVGTDPIDWIGPNVHTHRPSADAEEIAGDQPAGHLGPTSQYHCHSMPEDAAVWSVELNLIAHVRLLCNI